MFDWASIGLGTTTIVHKLSDMKVPIPSIYKKQIYLMLKLNLITKMEYGVLKL